MCGSLPRRVSGPKRFNRRAEGMEVELTPVDEAEYPQLVAVWEASVRATHDFLRDSDREFYRERLPGYFGAVRLTAARELGSGRIVAFLGTAGDGIEMLFVAPDDRGRGLGRRLVEYAVRVLGCRRVEVNEQNGQAVGFYERMGFRQAGREAVDGEGLPYPILRYEWAERG